MASFSCDHCLIAYNTKDGGMGPHTLISNLSLTNSVWVGNQGEQWKWGQPANSTFIGSNNLIVGNCYRTSQQLPGAAQTFAQSSGLPGAYLSDFCRAAGAVIAFSAGPGSTFNFVNNTIVTYSPTIFQLACTSAGQCGTTPLGFTNNIVLGYAPKYNVPGFNPGAAPGLYWNADGDPMEVVASNNIEYGIRNNGGDCSSGPGINGNICSDPMLLNEPLQGTVAPGEQALDAFTPSYGQIDSSSSFNLTPSSPAIGHGVSNSYVPTTDYNGSPQPSPVTIGALTQ
jgi:hypothetical protein